MKFRDIENNFTEHDICYRIQIDVPDFEDELSMELNCLDNDVLDLRRVVLKIIKKREILRNDVLVIENIESKELTVITEKIREAQSQQLTEEEFFVTRNKLAGEFFLTMFGILLGRVASVRTMFLDVDGNTFDDKYMKIKQELNLQDMLETDENGAHSFRSLQ